MKNKYWFTWDIFSSRVRVNFVDSEYLEETEKLHREWSR